MNILLDYVFPVSSVVSTAQASTAFLKQACLVVKPKSGQEGNVGEIYECVTMTEVAARTDNTEAQQLLNAGMSKVYILLASDLYLESFLDGHESDFYTLIISSDFDKDDVEEVQADGTITITSYANLVSGTDDVITINGVAFTAQAGAATLGQGNFQAATSNDATAASLAAQINAHDDLDGVVVATVVNAVVTLEAVEAGSPGNDITVAYTDNDTNVGATLGGLSGGKLAGGGGLFVSIFKGVIGISETDDDFLADQAAIENRCAFHTTSGNKAKNMCFAFGSLLAALNTWRNQQYITMPFADDIDTLGEANALFDDKISFVLDDSQYGKRLALFSCGGKAIIAPYILKNLEIDLQSKALQYITANQPQYTITEASLLETRLQEDVVNSYISRALINAGTVEVKLEQENFVASGYINVATPTALWRVFSEMRQTL